MDPTKLHEILSAVGEGNLSVQQAMEALTHLPYAGVEDATVDHHRALRTGFPEVVFGESKTAEQIAAIISELARGGVNVLVTRVDEQKASSVLARVSGATYSNKGRSILLRQKEVSIVGVGEIAIVTAGTSDIPVAEEAALVAELAGNKVSRIFDVGVAGVHRLLGKLPQLREAAVLIVVAGMEGALPSVVAGLVAAPVIAVPTSIGYGVSQGGFSALLGMLSSCAAGVTVVNIDNGFGAGYAASMINRVGSGLLHHGKGSVDAKP